MGRSYRVLVVDDDDVDRQVFVRLLARQAPGGSETRPAADGASGLAALAQDAFDCVLLDFRLPDMTGLEFVAQAAAAAGGALPCAVILVTGQGDEATAVEAMKLGVQDYLVKGRVDDGALWRAIIAAVTQKALQRRLATTLRDLTTANAALEGARDEAERANRAKSRFLASMSHELRTPLNGIMGYAELLRLEGGLDARQSDRVAAMRLAGTHLLDMIGGVLDLSRIETDAGAPRPTSVALAPFAEACLDLVRPMAEAKRLALGCVVADGTPARAEVDATRVRRVLLNLLGNAVKFTASGSVSLRVSGGGGGVRFDVVDTGPGIPLARTHRLFRAFDRLDAEQHTTAEGAGLGLALAAQLARQMGGRLDHENNPEGGSVFRLELPALADAPPPSPDTPPRPRRRATRPLEILVVDDTSMNRDIAAAFIRAAGHRPVCADSGAAAVAAVRGGTLDVVLMDVRMPGMDGLEATRRIRALGGACARVPIVALTAQAFSEQVAACRAAGMDGHLAKPFTPETLLDAVMRAAAGRGARARGKRGPAPLPKIAPAASRQLGNSMIRQ